MALDLACLALAVLPVLALIVLVRRADAARPEPIRALAATMGLGFLSCVPVAALEITERRILGHWALAGGRFLDAWVVAALTEECAKLAIVLGYVWRRAAFDEVMDGVVYAVAASLGFGLLENLVYVSGWFAGIFCSLPVVAGACSGVVGGRADDRLLLGVVRAVSAVPMHAIASGLMGYFLGRGRFADVSPAEAAFSDLPDVLPAVIPRPAAWVLLGLATAVGLHGSYDWAVFATGTHPVIFLELPVMLGAAGFLLHRLCRHAVALDDAIRGSGRPSLIIALFPRR